MHKLLLHTFEALEQENIPYCILRDGDRMHEYANGGEVDLLIPETHMRQLKSLLRRFGFAKVSAWGHAPHHFFVAYHNNSDCWIKLDVVTEVAYGNPAHALHTTLADNCLQYRRRCGFVQIPSPADEFVTLLLHCVLDKGYVTAHRGERLQMLCDQVEDEIYISQLLEQYWSPTSSWPVLSDLVKDGDWTSLLDQREAVANRLARREPVATVGRRIRDRLLRKMQRGAGYLQPRTPSVALLAPDGAGKSTLAHGLVGNFYFPVRLLYMGLYQNKRGSEGKKIKGLGLARNLTKQWQRYAVSRHYRASGKLVIFDRYSYDALLPSAQRPSLKGKLRRFRRWLLAYSCPPPNLILFLDAPGELLYSRKGERSPADLEAQRQQYLRLQSVLPQMVVVDASRGAESVRQEATNLIWQKYAQQFG
jgi:thymidylate kinase